MSIFACIIITSLSSWSHETNILQTKRICLCLCLQMEKRQGFAQLYCLFQQEGRYSATEQTTTFTPLFSCWRSTFMVKQTVQLSKVWSFFESANSPSWWALFRICRTYCLCSYLLTLASYVIAYLMSTDTANMTYWQVFRFYNCKVLQMILLSYFWYHAGMLPLILSSQYARVTELWDTTQTSWLDKWAVPKWIYLKLVIWD